MDRAKAPLRYFSEDVSNFSSTSQQDNIHSLSHIEVFSDLTPLSAGQHNCYKYVMYLRCDNTIVKVWFGLGKDHGLG